MDMDTRFGKRADQDKYPLAVIARSNLPLLDAVLERLYDGAKSMHFEGLPHQHVGSDLLLIDQPGEHGGRPIIRIVNRPLRFQAELVFHPRQHRSCGFHFIRLVDRGVFDIDDEADLQVNQIMGRIGEHRRSTKRGGPGRRIGERHLPRQAFG